MMEDIQPRVFESLLKEFDASPEQNQESRWDLLMAAHITGQQELSAHWEIHIKMLRFAIQTRDYAEAAGQLFRLCLVPFGHLTGRLPIGNSGRATVNAFRPMPINEKTRLLISNARARILSEKKQDRTQPTTPS